MSAQRLGFTRPSALQAQVSVQQGGELLGAQQAQASLPVAQQPERPSGADPLQRAILDAGSSHRTSGGAVRWNSLARDLVAKTKTAPPPASRGYALLSLGQHRALAAAKGLPAQVALAEVSRTILAELFPGEKAAIDALAKDELPKGRKTPGSDAEAARALGREIGRQVLAERAEDGSKGAPTGPLRTGPGVWFSAPDDKPAAPHWSDVRPFAIPAKGEAGRPTVAAPPAIDTPAFAAALAEVRQISDTRTPEQLGRAMFWADNAGTATPPGHWNKIASELIQKFGRSDEQAAAIFAAMNVAIADAGIVCWEVKYEHLLCRPSQMDPAIDVPAELGLPNHPSYVSGHASFSGAAAAVLAHFFPSEEASLWQKAEAAAFSRVEGGIHYRFDGDQGLELGKQCAAYALAQLG